jgi:hypothetical protein
MTGKLTSTFSLLIIVFVINGCCKAECINRSVTISFLKLRAVNTDSVSIISYTTGSNYTQRVDSNFINRPVPANDTSFSNLVDVIYADHDWKIIIHSLNKEYRLNNFDVDKRRCCGEKAYIVRSFYLDGVRKESDFAELQ